MYINHFVGLTLSRLPRALQVERQFLLLGFDERIGFLVALFRTHGHSESDETCVIHIVRRQIALKAHRTEKFHFSTSTSLGMIATIRTEHHTHSRMLTVVNSMNGPQTSSSIRFEEIMRFLHLGHCITSSFQRASPILHYIAFTLFPMSLITILRTMTHRRLYIKIDYSRFREPFTAWLF